VALRVLKATQGVTAQCTTTDPQQQAALRLADLVLATKGDGTAWTSGFDAQAETDDACDTLTAAGYITCVDSVADPTICDIE
jgi:hypothetical protein